MLYVRTCHHGSSRLLGINLEILPQEEVSYLSVMKILWCAEDG